MLKFSPANNKLKRLYKVPQLKRYFNTIGTGRSKRKRKVYSLDLLSGWSCPFAEECLSKVVTINGNHRIKDGPKTKFRCYSAQQEVMLPSTYELREHNYNLLKHAELPEMIGMLNALPFDLGVLRFEAAGDFFNQTYFDAAINVASMNPDCLFYAYTKSLPYWLERINDIPNNFILTASYGGRADHLISEYGLRSVTVVFSEEEANDLSLPIDSTDEHAAIPEWKNQSFALLLHGQQPKGSEAMEALKALNGKGSYGS